MRDSYFERAHNDWLDPDRHTDWPSGDDDSQWEVYEEEFESLDLEDQLDALLRDGDEEEENIYQMMRSEVMQ